MSTSGDPVVSVCAPAYNEEQGIEPVVRYWLDVLRKDGVPAEIVIANDGSTDGTLAVLQSLQAEAPELRVVDYAPNRGYGYALSEAIRAARGEVVVTLDSDGQFDLAEYRGLLQRLRDGGFDLVTGYRVRKRDRLPKVVADRALNLLVRLVFGLALRDTNCALKVMKRSVPLAFGLDARGYPTPTEIVAKAHTLGFKIGEMPITHLPRTNGKSRLKVGRTGWQFFWFLVYLRLKQSLFRARVLNRL
jgi:glycosyltransferase involved in cell wall biosynthesis